MSSFILLPGAGGAGWYWHRVVPLLEAAGHEAISVDFPADDPQAGLSAYAAIAVKAIGARSSVTLVAQSMGGFTAALVCARVPALIDRLVFVNAMIPTPGETAGDWWGHVGSHEAQVAAARRGGYPTAFDLDTYFLHDVPPDVAADGEKYQREEAAAAFSEPADFQAWPPVPTHAIGGRDDRFFPVEFQARVARERIGIDLDVLPGGHLMALSHPWELAQKLLAYDQG